jgi:hypothetical protein
LEQSKYEKHIIREVWHDEYPTKFHAQVTKPALILRKYEGNMEKDGHPPFALSWVPITQAFEMAPKPHVHDFDEFLMFIGGDSTNMLDLGGEVELALGEDENNMEKFVFTTSTIVHVPGGLWHCPLNFKKVNDPAKPILFENLMFTTKYSLLNQISK